MNFSKYVIREKITSRGGGIEIELDELGWPGAKMTAYINYLGGGMHSSIQTDCTISDYMEVPELSLIASMLKKYFYKLFFGFFSMREYIKNQLLPASAY